jgi:YbgC/YbaW family acyl-CoA thioester hydrolase
MKRQDFRFFHRLRVRWAEVDMQKIVFNAHYLMYFDTAIADYWRAIGLPYEAAMEHLEGDLYVKKAVVEFHASARADDQIDVAMRCARIGTSSMQFVCAIFRGDQLLITGELIYVFADPRTQTSRPVPPVLRGILDDYEAGRPVVELLQGEWAALGADAARVRTEVFIQEQAIPMEMEWDEADATALHAVVRNRLGQPLATGRLLTEAPGVGPHRPHGRHPRHARHAAGRRCVEGPAGGGLGARRPGSGAQRAAQCGRVLRPAGLRGAGPRLRGSGDCPCRNGSAALKGARPRKADPGAAPETATIPGLPRPVLAGVPGGLSPRHF